MSKKGSEPRSVNVAVVGLSGLDRDQAFFGVGKSCLCNRFVRPLADEYITEHTSVFSSSDFGGRVLNNDQFLYWGSSTKTAEDGSEFVIHVIEQTEFIDDATLMPLSRGGQLTPYPKRCAISKLSSPEKLMYISRDQVALQNDYEQVNLAGGKVAIDGFLVVYDAEATQSKRLEEQQERLLSSIVTYVQKSKKPFVLVATKCDDTQLNLLQEVHRFAQSKKLNVPIVETSAHENVNVDQAFVVLAQLIDRGRARSKVIPFTEAQKTQRELLEKAVQDFQRLIDRTVTDFRVIWKNTKKLVENEREFQIHRDLCGLEACKRLFNKHIRKLRKEFEERKLNGYLSRLPSALDELMPSASSMDLCHWNWQNCQKAIRNHKEFEKWMIVLPEETAWNESDHLLSDDSRVPFDILSLPRAEQVFQNHAEKLKAEEKRLRMMNEFRKLLELTPQIRPGTTWLEAAVLLENEESFQYLDDSDKTKIFDSYRRDITEKAKADFQELLFESAGLFSKLEPNTRPSISHEDMRLIKEALSEDDRYKKLDKLESDREIGLINHIALLYSPTRCLSGAERCRDRLMQEIVATTTYRPQFMDSSETLDSDDSQINLLILGSGGFAQAMENEIRTQCSYGDPDGLEFALDGRMYELEYQMVDGDMDPPEYALAGADLSAQVGCFCVYGSLSSLDFIRDCLDEMNTRSKYDSIDDSNPMQHPPPTSLILARNPNNDDIIHQLRKEGQELASRYNATFIDLPVARFSPGKMIHETQVVDAMRGLLENLKQQAHTNLSIEDLKESEPDLKIVLCAMCGDPYPVELILGPLLHHQNCWRSSTRPDTIILETYLGSDKRRVQITLTSYHRAYSLNYQMYHGYILVYSAIRKASLGTLSGFSGFIPQVPIQVLAVTGSASGASVVFHSHVAASLLAEGTNLASKLFGKFQTTSSQFQHQAGAFAAFFNQVWEKKRDSEVAYAKFQADQQLRLSQKQHNNQIRSRNDPLPEPPSKRPAHSEDEFNRRRSLSDRQQPVSPKTAHRMSEGAIDDDEINPYAVFNSIKRPVDATKNSQARDSRGSGELQPYATSTPNALFLSLQQGGGVPGATPASDSVWQKRESKTEDMYAQVDLSRKRSFRKSKDLTMNDSEVNLIENTLYANNNLVQSQKSARETPPTAREAPPPLPKRNYNLSEDFPPANSRTDTLRSIDDEGYNTFKHDDRKEENPYAAVADLQPRPPSISVEDPYFLRVKEKIDFFNNKVVMPRQDVWVKMDARQEEIHSSVPDLHRNRKGSDMEAPLAQQEDVSDPEYAQVQEALKNKLKVSEKPRPTIYAVAVVEEPSASDKKPKQHARVTSKGSLRLAHSAEDVSTLERISRRDTVGRPATGRREQRGYSATSDQGTGDELTLPRTEERPAKKKSGIRRSRSTTRNQTSTPNVPTEVHKKQLFPRGRSGKKESRKGGTMSSSQEDESSWGSSMDTRAKHKGLVKPTLLDLPQRQSDPGTEEETEDDPGSPGHKPRKSPWSSSRKKPSREEREALKQRKKEEKKSREDEKRLKRIEKKKRKDKEKIDKFFESRQKKVNNFTYFAQPLEAICEPGSYVPVFIDKCIDFVENAGMQIEGIYRINGNTADISLIEQKVEEDPHVELAELGVGVHAVTGAFKSFLKLLPEPIIPGSYQNAFHDAMIHADANSRLERLKQLLHEIPPHNLAVVKRIMFHLYRVTEYSKDNLMESRNLSLVLFPTIIRPDFIRLEMSTQMYFILFIQTCIEKCDYLFSTDDN